MITKRILSILLVALASLVTLPGQAAMVGTAQMQQHHNLLMVDLQSITQKRDWIREQLVLGGVVKANAELRVAAMTDVQVQQIHQRMDEMPAGSSTGGTIILILLILVITDAMGYTDIFPFIRPVD